MNRVKKIDYFNEDVINRFVNIYQIDKLEATIIFEETIKFLSLSQLNFNFFIDDSLLIIDEMWRNFILFTNEYEKFCFENFGRFIHHIPSTDQDKKDFEKNKLQELKILKNRTRKQYEIIFDNFGEETLNRWYVDFADKYTHEYIKSIIK